MNTTTLRETIGAWKNAAAEVATEVYERCKSGKLSYTEAWNQLPGPAPRFSVNGQTITISYMHILPRAIREMYDGKEAERVQADAGRQLRQETDAEYLQHLYDQLELAERRERS
jgi:hypothetical protein